MTTLNALLIKKVDDTLQVTGPVTSSYFPLQTLEDMANPENYNYDLVILLCSYEEMIKPEHKEELMLFELCIKNSPHLAMEKSKFKGIKTIGYLLGTTLERELKNIDLITFSNLTYTKV